MAIITTDPAASALKTLQIESTQLLPNVLPTLAIGDVIKVTVRQNPPQGLGLIYFKGLLVKAALPDNVSPGDKLLAKLTESNNNVVLKILEHEKTSAPESVSSLAPELLADLEELVENTGPQGLRPLSPFQVNETLQKVATLEKNIAQVLKNIATPEALVDAKAAFEQLLHAADGTLAQTFKDVSQQLRTFVKDNGPAQPHEKLIALRSELATLLEDAAVANEDAGAEIFRLADALQGEIRDRGRSIPVDKESVKSAVERAKVAVKTFNQPTTSPSESTPLLENAVKQLGTVITSFEEVAKLDRKTADNLLQIASRFEQMASTQETITKLNPVMQALGEPALILFPFLVQGLIRHSEVTVETNDKVEGEGEKNKSGGRSREPYQRVQVSVPLPTLGNVDVDIAHRTDEILVRFTVTDRDVGDFLLEQLENLGPSLRAQGFKRADLVAHVGAKQETLPAWSFGLHASMSIRA